MKTQRLYMLGALAVAAGLANALLGAPPKVADPTVNELAARVATMERQIKQLEAKVQDLSKGPSIQLLRETVPGNSPEQLPPGWQPHVFNGQPYYLVPLAATATNGVPSINRK